ncbi:NADH oxidase [Giardia muris]|uniref:NADH oxidase n=1 Tax=Giardia muris TaxID=5742 RepID=A0A3S7RND6_GIAMU|nr:NADH oxidase lateral transfer candidate [Giardia muris]TNJ27309.1 NADH oxidase [Giardia muris]|eukprot:TNJ27309.1 NADH oxidase [Giardia muris]
MKVIIIGCNHGGTAVATTLKKHDPSIEVSIYERNNNLSFLSCGIALGVHGTVREMESLFYSSPDALTALGCVCHMEHDIQDVDFTTKKVTAVNMQNGEQFVEKFDKIVFATGSWPVVPKLEGIDSSRVLLCKNYYHAKKIVAEFGHHDNTKHCIVIGAGYIGVELAEAFGLKGQPCTLIDGADRIMARNFDKEFTDVCEEQMRAHGVQLRLGEMIQGFTESGDKITVRTNKGEYTGDSAILCIGFRPVTEMILESAKKHGVHLEMQGPAIKIDECARTSLPGVYAIGDCATVHFNPTDDDRYIPLATNAIRSGVAAAAHILGLKNVRMCGTQATSGIRVFKNNLSATGLTEQGAIDAGFKNVKTIRVDDTDRPAFMPEYHTVTMKIVYDGETRRVLGGQMMSEAPVVQAMNTLSVCIQNEYTVEKLLMQDFFFQPHYNNPWNNLNIAAISALGK